MDTGRLIIRKLKPKDAKAMQAAMEDPVSRTVKSGLVDIVQATQSAAAKEFAELICSYRPAVLAYAVINKQTNALIGSVTIYPTISALICPAIGYNTMSFGVWIVPEEQRKGFAKEAVAAVFEQTFSRHPDLDLIQGGCFEENQASQELMLSLGFKPVNWISKYQGRNTLTFVKYRDELYPLRPDLKDSTSPSDPPRPIF